LKRRKSADEWTIRKEKRGGGGEMRERGDVGDGVGGADPEKKPRKPASRISCAQ